MEKAKNIMMLSAGSVGVILSQFFGGMDGMLLALLVFMGIDMVTGILVAVNGRSKKTESGGLNSNISWLGISKKVTVLLFIAAAHWADGLIGVHYLRTGVIFGYAANELLSIVENGALLGLPGSSILEKAIDILKEKGGETVKIEEQKEE